MGLRAREPGGLIIETARIWKKFGESEYPTCSRIFFLCGGWVIYFSIWIFFYTLHRVYR